MRVRERGVKTAVKIDPIAARARGFLCAQPENHAPWCGAHNFRAATCPAACGSGRGNPVVEVGPRVITSQWQVMNGGRQGWARAAPALRTLAHIV